MRQVFTIGFSKKSLREFIKLLKNAKVTKLVDIRLNNTSQLAGYAKKDDLAYILELVQIKYIHDKSLAPDRDLLNRYKKGDVNWSEYKRIYNDILNNRKIKDKSYDIIGNDTPVFLCSEEKADYCHRRLLVEYFQKNMHEELKITHL